jgi:hypothetical protein
MAPYTLECVSIDPRKPETPCGRQFSDPTLLGALALVAVHAESIVIGPYGEHPHRYFDVIDDTGSPLREVPNVNIGLQVVVTSGQAVSVSKDGGRTFRKGFDPEFVIPAEDLEAARKKLKR